MIRVDGDGDDTGALPTRLQVDRAAPIFIVGAPRSGTTLLRAILNRHPSIGICDETYYSYYVYTRRRAFGNLRDATNRRHLVEQYLATQRIKRLGLDPETLSTTLFREGETYPAFFTSLMHFYAMQHGKTRYGEKTPDHAIFSETLCQWYPNCKLIHLIRDPRDVVASLLRMPWGRTSIVANARQWLCCTLSAHRCHERKNYLLVYYENLVSQPDQELERICAFIGEEYFPVMLVPEDQSADEWWFQRAYGRLTTEQIGKWHAQLTAKQVVLVERVVGPCMQQFGYEPSGQSASAATAAAASVGEWLDAFCLRITKLPRLWYYWVQPTRLAAEEAWIDGHV